MPLVSRPPGGRQNFQMHLGIIQGFVEPRVGTLVIYNQFAFVSILLQLLLVG